MADWSYGPKEDADVPSLEVFKARLERCPCPWQRSWTRWSLQVPSNLYHSVILRPVKMLLNKRRKS